MGGGLLNQTHTREFGIQRGFPGLKSLPAPDILEATLSEGYVCLITSDGTPLTSTLASSLAARNWKVVVLSYPGIVSGETEVSAQEAKEHLTANFSEDHWKTVGMPVMSEEYLQRMLAEITSSEGPIGAVIHLNPSQPLSQEKIIVKHVFLLAKHLKEALNAAALAGRSIFMSVTRLDGEFGLSRQADFDPISGGLFGLVKTLNLEWEPVFCRAVDLSPEFTALESVERIIAELYDPNRLITEVGYSPNGGRQTLVIEQRPAKEETT